MTYGHTHVHLSSESMEIAENAQNLGTLFM